MVHENLKKIRIAKGVTQTHLAKVLKVTTMTYSRLENGETKIDVERLKILSRALDINVGIFFDNKLTDSVIYNMSEGKEVV
ncbi:helix-turn-helix transcriptional regulator [Sporosarcina saromensis]|uniref:Helix-turn-helix transcriptional regulator n=1 Tax=Sporosarcina saromensis TaxID=359365 RepID=A0ABU4GA84_9BACL|nr:helix-turn-helix transcriptional regulator [Sporosarcina saromensis]MDW0113816.1 helix-turn-helix transcriptional regulator [Sporosarcina saromensis]